MLTSPLTLLETVFMRPFDLGKRGIKYIYNFPIICNGISFTNVNSKHLSIVFFNSSKSEKYEMFTDAVIQ